MRRNRNIAGLVAAFVLIPLALSAQSAQTFSLQFSGLGSVPFGGGLAGVDPGPGWEAQLRINPSVWSFGFGVERTSHDAPDVVGTVTLLGGFFEPRIVIDVGSDGVAPYLAVRAAVSQMTLSIPSGEGTANGFTLNGGGGLLFRLGGRTNFDLGATIGYKDLGTTTPIAMTIYDMGTGMNVVVRAGLAIGLGG